MGLLLSYPFFSLYHKVYIPFRARGSSQSLGQCLIQKKSDCNPLVTQSCLTLCNPNGQPHARLPCLSPSPRVCPNLSPLNQWCHPTTSSSVTPFSSSCQSFPASGSFPMSQFFAPGGQSIRAPASVLPMNIHGWFPSGLTGLISLQSKGLSRVSPAPQFESINSSVLKTSLWSKLSYSTTTL